VEDGLRQRSRGRRRHRGLTTLALYEYQCASCGRKTEVIQRFSDPPPKKCPHCSGKLVKLLSTPAFQFKGSGFYSTDYGKSGGKPEDSSKEKEGDSKDKEGDSSKVKEGDSSKGKEGEGGAPGETGAETKGGSEGDSSKGKSDSAPGAASDGAAAKTSTAPSSPSKKNTRRK
jgi:putative FmdB family regulatory protein